MNILNHNAAKLNDIVFENRNKSYGAYAIRSSYDTTLLKSVSITAALFIGIALAGAALTHSQPEELKLDTGTNQWNDSLISIIYNYTKPEKTCGGDIVVSHTKPVVIPTNIIDEKKEDKTEQKNNTIETIDNSNNNPNANTTDNGNTGTSTSTVSTGDNTNMNTLPTSEPVLIADVMPKYDDMQKFLRDNLIYPLFAKEVGITGKVVVNYVVNENGDVESPVIVKHLGGGCDEEVLRVIKLMHKWIPGMVHGKAVKVRFNQVIDFKLQ